jgi:hypothetical protein
MNASIELKNLYLRLLDAYTTGDEHFMECFTASDILVIGTDPEEWWDNHAVFLEAVRVQLKEFRDAGLIARPGNPQVQVEGQIGWIVDRPQFAFPDGTVLESRLTAILRWQEGGWKFVQQHFSIGVANPDVSDIIVAGEEGLALEATA